MTQVIKAAIAVGDSVGALHSHYHHLYSERYRWFRKLVTTGESPAWLDAQEVGIIEHAYEAKLTGGECQMDNDSVVGGMLCKSFITLSNAITSCRAESVRDAELAMWAYCGVFPKGLWDVLRSAARSKSWRGLMVRPGKMAQYVLLSQIAMYQEHLRGGEAASRAYRRRFWWIPCSRKYLPGGPGAAMLWETICH